MTVHEIYYLTCSTCGELYKDEWDSVVYMETTEEVRDEAEVDGWCCHTVDTHLDERDYCPDCSS